MDDGDFVVDRRASKAQEWQQQLHKYSKTNKIENKDN